MKKRDVVAVADKKTYVKLTVSLETAEFLINLLSKDVEGESRSEKSSRMLIANKLSECVNEDEDED